MALPQRYVELAEKEVYTEDEYFEFERTSFGRWEYVNGEIRAMAGGADDHNAISSNIVRTLGLALVPRRCRVYGSDMRVHTGDGVNTFPDVSVVCGPRRYHRGRTDTITNPLLIAEVLSASTGTYDQGDKFRHYQTIPTLADYLLVVPDEARVLHYSRNGDHWDFRSIMGLESSVSLPSVETPLALADIYALIEFGSEEHA
jgi:Uma2 family endonuclease